MHKIPTIAKCYFNTQYFKPIHRFSYDFYNAQSGYTIILVSPQKNIQHYIEIYLQN
jgi:hypothetical protein